MSVEYPPKRPPIVYACHCSICSIHVFWTVFHGDWQIGALSRQNSKNFSHQIKLQYKEVSVMVQKSLIDQPIKHKFYCACTVILERLAPPHTAKPNRRHKSKLLACVEELMSEGKWIWAYRSKTYLCSTRLQAGRKLQQVQAAGAK